MIDFVNFTKEQFPKEYLDRIDRFNRLFLAGCGHTFEEDDLFEYEMGCMKQSLSFYEYFKERPQEELEALCKSVENLYGLTEKIKENLPYFDEGHSGNSMGASWQLFLCYRNKPELIPYMHGSLANLVGDAGYYDDRTDIPV